MEAIFDKRFSEDKDVMSNRIWREMMLNGVPFVGMSSGNRHGERVRINILLYESILLLSYDSCFTILFFPQILDLPI